MGTFNFSNMQGGQGASMQNVPREFREAVEQAKSVPVGSSANNNKGSIWEDIKSLFSGGDVDTSKGFIDATGTWNNGTEQELEPYTQKAKYPTTEKAWNNSTAGQMVNSNAYKKYFYSREDVLQEAKTISAATNIPENAILSSADNLKNARDIYNYQQRSMDPKKVFEAYPELSALAQKSDTDAAIALHNLKNVRQTQGIVEAAKTGWELDSLMNERGRLGYAAMNGKSLTDADLKRLEEIEKRQKESKELPGLLEDPAGAIAGGTVQSGKMMLRNMLNGQKLGMYGAAAGAIIGGAGAAATTGGAGLMAGAAAGSRFGYSVGSRIGMAQDMYDEIAGNNYLDYKKYKDKNGHQLLTDNQARVYAAASAALETGIEFSNTEKILNIVKGRPGEQSLKQIIEAAKDNKELRSLLTSYVRNGMKNIGTVAVSESAEEGVQEMSNRIITDIAAYNNPDGDIPTYSVKDILVGGLEASWQALSTSIGFGVGAQAASTTGYARRMAAALAIKTEEQKANMHTANGISMLRSLAEDIKSNELFKKSPEVYHEVLENQLKGTELESVNIDTEIVLNQEGGYELLKEAADKAGLSEEQFNQLVETKADLKINTAEYVEKYLPNDLGAKLEDYITFDDIGECLARNRMYASRLRREMDKVLAFEERQREDALNNFLEQNFPDAAQREVAEAVIRRFPDNPKEGVKEIRKSLQEKIDAPLKEIIAQLKEGAGNGASIIAIDADGKTTSWEHSDHGRGIRVSNNAPWYQKWYKEHGRKPTETEYRELAYDIYTGHNSYGLLGWENNSKEEDQWYKDNEAAMEATQEAIDRLNKLAPRLEKIDPGELTITEGLSVEAFEVYQQMRKQLGEAPSKEVRQAAQMNAILFARMADRMAEWHRQAGQTKYTALNFARSVGLNFGGRPIEGLRQTASVHIGTELTVQRPAEEVVQAYNKLINQRPSEFTQKIYGTDFKSRKVSASKIFNNLYKNEQGRPITVNNKYGDEIEIPRTAFKEISGHAKKDNLLELTPYIGELIQTARYLYTRLSDTSREKRMSDHVLEYRTYAKKIKVNDIEYYAKIVVRKEKSKKLKLHDVDITEIKNETSDSRNGGAEYSSASKLDKLASVKNSIPWSINGVKTKIKVETKDSANPDYQSGAKPNSSTFVKNSIPWWLNEVKTKLIDNEQRYEQKAWHGTAYNFERFDIRKIGAGVGDQVHGWGLYFAKDRKISEAYKEALSENGDADASLFKVEVPENNVLLDEQKTFINQNKNVQALLKKAIESLDESQSLKFWEDLLKFKLRALDKAEKVQFKIDGFNKLADGIGKLVESRSNTFGYRVFARSLERYGYSEEEIEKLKSDGEYRKQEQEKLRSQATALEPELEQAKAEDIAERVKVVKQAKADISGTLGGMFTGNKIYDALARAVGEDGYNWRGASELLNEHGIKGITYEGMKDGRCFVVFDDKAVDIIERYNQSAMRQENKRYVLNHDGNIDWGYINAVKADNQAEIKKAPVRMQIGYQVGKGEAGAGYTHIVRRHTDFIKGKGYKNASEAIYDVLNNADFAVKSVARNGRERLALVKDLTPRTSVSLMLDYTEDNGAKYYTIVSLMPQSPKQVKIAKEKALSFNGSVRPYTATGSGAFFTPAETKAGIEGGSFAGKDNAFTVSIADADKYVNEYTYEAGEQKGLYKIKGQSVFKATGEKVISLFEAADQSTFMHEMAHVYLHDMLQLAKLPDAPKQLLADVKTLNDWASWRPETFDKEYKGTALEREFKKLHEQICDATKFGYLKIDGRDVNVEQLKMQWAQERFARGFENYLREGKAPAESIKSIFRRFKEWLGKIYRAFVQIGGAPSKEVRAVMDRMIASEEEIDIAMTKKGVDDFTRAGGMDYLADNAKQVYDRMVQRAKEEAKEKVLKIALKDVKEDYRKQEKEFFVQEEAEYREKLMREPAFVIQQHINNNPNLSTSAVCRTLGMSVEDYVAKLKEYGGSIDTAVKTHMKEFKKNIDNSGFDAKYFREKAEEVVEESRYRKLAAAMELNAFEGIAKAQRRINGQAVANMKLTDDEKGVMGTVNKLTAQSQKIDQLKAEKKEEAAKHRIEKKELREKLESEKKEGIAKQREEKEHIIANVRGLRDAALKHYKEYVDYVEKKLETMPVGEANNYQMWRRKSAQAQHNSERALATAKWDLAIKYKRAQIIYDMFTDKAVRNAKQIKKLEDGLVKKRQTIIKNKNISANERYAYNHLLYVFGFVDADAPMPPTYQQENGFMGVLQKSDAPREIDGLFLECPFFTADGFCNLPEWLLSAAMGDKQRESGHNDLSNDQVKMLAQVMNIIYKRGADDMKLLHSMDVATVEEAIVGIEAQARQRIVEPVISDPTGATKKKWNEEAQRAISDANQFLTKPEVELKKLGSLAVEYIYEPLKQAADKELRLSHDMYKKIEAVFGVYTPEELRDVRNVQKYKFGTSMLTREQVIMIALNWGTEINAKRVIDGYHVTEHDVRNVLAELTEEEWNLVDSIWKLYDEHWDDLCKIEAHMTGAVLEKQPGKSFTILGNDGKKYTLEGGYFPIKYDPLDAKTQEQQADAAAKQQAGMSNLAMSLGKGFLKERSNATIERRLDLRFDVISKSLADVIHLVAFREPVRDVRRIVLNDSFRNLATRYLGDAAYKNIKKWTSDCWMEEPMSTSWFDRAAAKLRNAQTMGVMGYRVSTALLNLANVPSVAHYMGAAELFHALKKFYSAPRQYTDFIFQRSVFMAERSETMDSSISDAIKKESFGENLPGVGKLGKHLKEHAFKMLTWTDLMLALPLWQHEYEKAYNAELENGGTPEQAQEAGVAAGDAGVRWCFGSGRTVDKAAVQRKTGEFMKQLTMYYSYQSTVYNAINYKIWEARMGYKQAVAWADTNKNKELMKAVIKAGNALLMWTILPAVITAVLRAGMSGDDDDLKPEKLLKGVAKESLMGWVGAIPVLRDAVPFFLAKAFDDKKYAPKIPLESTIEQADRVISSIYNDKKTFTDMMRESGKLLTQVAGVPGTLVDAFTTTLSYLETGFDADVADYLRALIFDKQLKKDKK